MIIIKVSKELENDIQTIFKKIEKKIPLRCVVKINGEHYRRIRPVKNKFIKSDEKFIKLENDIVKAAVILIDYDGEKTVRIPDYKVIFV